MIIFSVLIVNVFVVSVLGYHVNSKTDIKEVVEGIHTVYEPVYAKRGNILDINDNVLVEDAEAYTLYAYIADDRFGINNVPAYVTDKEAAATTIAKVLDAPYSEILEYLNMDAKQVEFGSYGKYISASQKRELEASGITGLGYTPAVKRDYYSSRFATTLLGMTRFDEETKLQEGIMGIEQYYNDVLSGTNGESVYRQDSSQYRFDTIDSLSYEAKNGKNIRLTVDKIIQSSLDNALNNFLTLEEINADEAWGAVVNLKTGAILAISDAPSFDVEDENTLYLNRATEYEYEPGSTMKTITYAIGLNEGAMTPDDLFDGKPFYLRTDPETGALSRATSPGPYTVTINNPSQEVYPIITFKEGLQRSSNVMIAELLTNRLSTNVYNDYLHKLGFFEEVGIGRIPEADGVELWNYHHEVITTGYGQGSMVTMLQLIQAHTAVFGDGAVTKPYIVDSVIDTKTGNLEYQASVQKGEQLFDEETVQSVRDALYGNVYVTRFGNQRYAMEEVNMMAKSGTAEIVIDGQYSNRKYIYSAVLAFPYEDPEYIVYYAYKANAGHRLGAASTEIKNVIKTVITTYPLDTMVDNETDSVVHQGEIGNYVNKSVKDAVANLKEQGYDVVVIGDGKTVLNQYPQKGTSLLNNERVLLLSKIENMKVPNMSKWSLKEVNAWANFANIEIVMKGSGFVKAQSIAPNTTVTDGMVLTVELE